MHDHTHIHRHVDDQKTYRWILHIIFPKLACIGLLGYRVLCPINCLTHLNPLFLLLSYMPVHPGDLLALQSSWCCTGNLNDAPVGSGEGRLHRAMLVTALPIAGSAVSLHLEEKGKGKGVICLPQISAAEHHRSNLLKEFSTACSNWSCFITRTRNPQSNNFQKTPWFQKSGLLWKYLLQMKQAPDMQTAVAAHSFQAAVSSTQNRNHKLHLAILRTSFIWLICQCAIFQLGGREFLSQNNNTVIILCVIICRFLSHQHQ